MGPSPRGGRQVPRRAAIIAAASGAIALTLLWASALSSSDEIFDEYGLQGVARAVVFACYVPMVLWGPLLGAVTVSYARRTRRLSLAGGPGGRR